MRWRSRTIGGGVGCWRLLVVPRGGCLPFLDLLPACFALFNGEAHSPGHVVPIGAQLRVSFEFHKSAICVAVPIVPLGCLVQRRRCLSLSKRTSWLWRAGGGVRGGWSGWRLWDGRMKRSGFPGRRGRRDRKWTRWRCRYWRKTAVKMWVNLSCMDQVEVVCVELQGCRWLVGKCAVAG